KSRFMARPMASGVVLRLRRRRRPSEASKVASNWRQTSAGRNVDMTGFPYSADSDMPTKYGTLACGRGDQATCQRIAWALGARITAVERCHVERNRGEVLQSDGIGWQCLERGMRFEVALACCTGIDLACSAVLLRQQHTQALMDHFAAVGTAQPGRAPRCSTASTA